MNRNDFDIEWREHPARGRCCTAKLNKSVEKKTGDPEATTVEIAEALAEVLMRPEVRDSLLHGLMVPCRLIDREYPEVAQGVARNIAEGLGDWDRSPLRWGLWKVHEKIEATKAKLKAGSEERRRQINASLPLKLASFCECIDLDDHGFMAMWKAGIDLSDGQYVAEDQFERFYGEYDPKPPRNYCYTTWQDAEDAEKKGYCCVAWEGDKELIMEAFRKAGFAVEPGEPDHRFIVSLQQGDKNDQ